MLMQLYTACYVMRSRIPPIWLASLQIKERARAHLSPPPNGERVGADRTHNQKMLIHAVTVELVCTHGSQTLIGWGPGRTERKVPLHRSKQDLPTPR